MDIVKTCVTLKMSFSKNCGTLKNTEVYKKFESCWLSIPAVAEFFMQKRKLQTLKVKTLLWCCNLNAKPFSIKLKPIFYAEKEIPTLLLKHSYGAAT